MSVGNLRHRPEGLSLCLGSFCRGLISLPRLIHFFDLVLPQLIVQAAWAGEEKTPWSCHLKFFTCLSERALDLRLRLMSLVRDLVRCLSTMDCLYPRDLPQPARGKKTLWSCAAANLFAFMFVYLHDMACPCDLAVTFV